jgi:hypothetical protein
VAVKAELDHQVQVKMVETAVQAEAELVVLQVELILVDQEL